MFGHKGGTNRQGMSMPANWTPDDERSAQEQADAHSILPGGPRFGFFRPIFRHAMFAWVLGYECSICGHQAAPEERECGICCHQVAPDKRDSLCGYICRRCGSPMVRLPDKSFEELAKQPQFARSAHAHGDIIA